MFEFLNVHMVCTYLAIIFPNKLSLQKYFSYKHMCLKAFSGLKNDNFLRIMGDKTVDHEMDLQLLFFANLQTYCILGRESGAKCDILYTQTIHITSCTCYHILSDTSVLHCVSNTQHAGLPISLQIQNKSEVNHLLL